MSLYKRVEKGLAKLTFNTQDRLTLYEDLAFCLQNKQKLIDCVSFMLDSKGKRASGRLCLSDLLAALNKGKSLDEGLKHWIPQHEQAILAAGSHENNIVDALLRAKAITTRLREMKNTLFNTLLMPLMLLISTLGLVVMLSVYLLPQLSQMFPREHWQGALSMLAAVSDFFGQHIIAWCIAFVGLTVFTLWSLPNLTGGPRKILDYLPPWSIYRQIQGITFLLNFSALTKSQTQTNEAISQLMRFASPWLYERLYKVRQGLHNGLTLGMALKQSQYAFPSRLAIDRLVLLTRGDNAHDVIENFAHYQLGKTVENIKKSSSFFNLLIVLTNALYMGLVVFSIQDLSNLTP